MDTIGILLKLGKLAGAGHGCAVDEIGRNDLLISVVGVGVHKKAENGTFKTCTQSSVKMESRTRYLGCGFGIENAQILA